MDDHQEAVTVRITHFDASKKGSREINDTEIEKRGRWKKYNCGGQFFVIQGFS